MQILYSVKIKIISKSRFRIIIEINAEVLVQLFFHPLLKSPLGGLGAFPYSFHLFNSLYSLCIGNPIMLKYEPLICSTPTKPIHSCTPYDPALS